MLPRSNRASAGPKAPGTGNVRISRRPDSRRSRIFPARGSRNQGRARRAAIGERHAKSFKPGDEFQPETANGRPRTCPISAVFVFIGADPGCSWLPDGSRGTARIYPHRRGRPEIRQVAAEGPRAVPAGNDPPRNPRRRRHPRRFHQARRIRRGRRIAGRHLRPQTDRDRAGRWPTSHKMRSSTSMEQ
jgi:hypothetical protein